MGFAARLDEIGRPAWIAVTIVAFWFWWPVGLVLLAYLAFNRRRHRRMEGGSRGQWQFPDMMGRATRGFSYAAPSGNRAFDDYRAETLRRLEDEQKEFVEYLDRLRQARDKQEFDQFMADRRKQPPRSDEIVQG